MQNKNSVKNSYRFKADKNEKLYIFIFLLIFAIVYMSIILSGKMYIFIDIGADTYCSYWPSIAYANDLLQDLKLWDMSLGLGASTITYISYFLADPFNWCCFFFEKENMDMGIFIGLTLKNLCLAYYAYRYIGKKNIHDYMKVICSLMIVFCGWFVGWGQHYNFATVFVCFIAILYYLECWLHDKKYIGLVMTTALLAIISPYYCYMTLLFLVFYYFVSLYYIYRTREFYWKEVIGHAFKTAGLFLTGLGCAGVVFLPYMSDTLASPRVSGKLWPSLKFGSIQEYVSIVLRMLSNSILGINGSFAGVSNFYECPFMYVGALAVLLLPLFLVDKKLRKKYWIVIVGTISAFVFINVAAPVFNAFSTKSYRWTYLFVPVFVLACAVAIELIGKKLHKRVLVSEIIVADILMIIYYVWFSQTYESDIYVLSGIVVTIVLLNIYGIVFVFGRSKQHFYKVLLAVVSVDLCINAYISVHDRSLIARDSKATMNYFDDSKVAVSYLEDIDSSFYRISKNYGQIDLNDSMFQEYNGEKLYSSILSAEMWDMMELFDLRVKNSNYFYGFDDKQILRNLSAGKYRFSKVECEYYGYRLINTIGSIYIYENEYASNFGVLYDSYVLRGELDGLDSIELQSVLLDHCIIENEDCDEEIKRLSDGSEDIREITSQLFKKDDEINQNSYSINMEFQNEKPLIVEIGGTDLVGCIEIYTEESGMIVADSIAYSIEEGVQRYYIDNLNITTLSFVSSQGLLHEVQLYEIKTEELQNRLDSLNSEFFQTTYFSDSYISGYTECQNDRILLLPIPYNENWMILVNGEEAKIYRADAGYMAVIVPKGHSEIAIRYNSKVFLLGTVLTLISLSILIVIGVAGYKRKEETNEKERCRNVRI